MLPDLRQELIQDTEPSQLNVFYLFQLPHLNPRCINGNLYALTYYYQYDSTVNINGALFNWTVIIVNKDLVITDSIVIESHPSEQNCRVNIGQKVTCSDTTRVTDLQLPKENFAFGIVSSQGNTHGATLLAFHSAVSNYLVKAIHFPHDYRNPLTKGSQLNVRGRQPSQISVRCLWFMIGNETKMMVV